jgi:hypothetical protein
MRKRSERPTTPPPFDVAQYAKDSDACVRGVPQHAAPGPAYEAPPEPPRSETRLVSHAKRGAAITDETWAHDAIGAPTVVLAYESVRRLPLDPRAGFLLSLMDGTMDLETVVDVSTMPRAEALRLMRVLFESGVIAFK